MKKTTTAFIDSQLSLPNAETSFLFMIWCNLGSGQFSKGQTNFIQPVFKLYQYGIEKGLFLQQGYLPGTIYINSCVMAAKAKANTWLAQFRKDYRPLLKPYLKEETLALTQAFVAFHQEQFLEARAILDNISTNDLHFRIRLHSLSVRCLLELHLLNDSFYHVLSSRIRAFKRMINNKQKLHRQRRDAYRNFADLTMDLAKLGRNSSITTDEHNALQQKINTTSSLVLKDWLLQKLSQLYSNQ